MSRRVSRNAKLTDPMTLTPRNNQGDEDDFQVFYNPRFVHDGTDEANLAKDHELLSQSGEGPTEKRVKPLIQGERPDAKAGDSKA